MMYGAECWAINKKKEIKIKVAVMRMPRWLCGVSRNDRNRNKSYKKCNNRGRKQEIEMIWTC